VEKVTKSFPHLLTNYLVCDLKKSGSWRVFFIMG